jgi:hypothetical protein
MNARAFKSMVCSTAGTSTANGRGFQHAMGRTSSKQDIIQKAIKYVKGELHTPDNPFFAFQNRIDSHTE